MPPAGDIACARPLPLQPAHGARAGTAGCRPWLRGALEGVVSRQREDYGLEVFEHGPRARLWRAGLSAGFINLAGSIVLVGGRWHVGHGRLAGRRLAGARRILFGRLTGIGPSDARICLRLSSGVMPVLHAAFPRWRRWWGVHLSDRRRRAVSPVLSRGVLWRLGCGVRLRLGHGIRLHLGRDVLLCLGGGLLLHRLHDALFLVSSGDGPSGRELLRGSVSQLVLACAL